jgi:hypothetical protein
LLSLIVMGRSSTAALLVVTTAHIVMLSLVPIVVVLVT